ncbi:coat protein F [Halolactibacillus alkaliphilus]|uniref:Coat protein F n=1 Tax=Halolactibacillus alkaliphilus TaxID=442899 RepID=A0A511X0U8_9BACI|nr:spore coat protein [Halolactibacillus alkaliphilus]GEN56569.1 coat protein F [Halolactibacillus alkaliphilus]GGN69230.1 coat protein F [Halolactibacillus alkaliphilus]SFO75296.1 Coat F domain-containing protein [Halolactibacillus alkaliphilus]
MQDKDIVNDYLTGINASLTGYATVITETHDPELRQTIIQLRNQDEVRQRQLYDYALKHQYYTPAASAPEDIIQMTKSTLTTQS